MHKYVSFPYLKYIIEKYIENPIHYIDYFSLFTSLVGCRNDENCGIEEACINRVCQNPCSMFGACGRNANCRPINHKPECTCPANFRGNPNVVCEQGQFVFWGFYIISSPYFSFRLKANCL